MRPIIGAFSFFFLVLSQSIAQIPSQTAFDAAAADLILKEAGELQSTQPQSVGEKLAPLLTELRQARQGGTLGEDASRILRDALLLLMRTQIMLLAPEQEILTQVREILIANPKIDETIFNPREKLLLNKVRSGETGSLSLETTPPGAILSYLGAELGTTPAKVDLIAGAYRFQLRLPGYLDQEIDATIQPLEILTLSRSMRRRAVEIPISINAPSTTIVFNGKTLGVSQDYKTWLASLPAERRAEYEALIQQWNVDPFASSFLRLVDVPVDEPFKLEFKAACYQPLRVEAKVTEQEVDWAKRAFVVPALRNVQLTKDTGSIEVSSTPSGAEVWLDGSLQGQTPLEGKELCAGTHRIQILHDAGQYVQDISVQHGRTLRVRGRLRPALAFLGIYAVDPQNNELALETADSKAVANKIALNCRDFADPLVMPEDIELLRKKGSLPISRLLQDATEEGDLDGQIKKTSASAARSELLLIGLRSEKGYMLKLYSTLQPVPDLIEIQSLDESNLDFLISQLNKTDKIRARLQIADFGLEMADSPNGLTIMHLSSAVVSRKTALAPGQIVKSVDAKPMGFADFQNYMRSKKPDQTVVLEVMTDKEKVALVPIPIRQLGAEYPWDRPDGFPNSVLTILRHLISRDPLSEESKFAALSLARGFMKLKQWKLALEYLAKANLEPHKTGICPGTVLYYQGRCYEELGNATQAESYYMRARDYTEATIGMTDSLSVPVLAEQRIQSLKKR
ncbi:MAG: PEGA domain-containing protein [Acidobacteria bacterium]|nr:PEGA domain-containing protein [Acidobacteriota bacterium]